MVFLQTKPIMNEIQLSQIFFVTLSLVCPFVSGILFSHLFGPFGGQLIPVWRYVVTDSEGKGAKYGQWNTCMEKLKEATERLANEKSFPNTETYIERANRRIKL